MTLSKRIINVQIFRPWHSFSYFATHFQQDMCKVSLKKNTVWKLKHIISQCLLWGYGWIILWTRKVENWLGSCHNIVWSTRSSDAVKLCPTRKKLTFHCLFFFCCFFPPTCPKTKGFFSKLHKFQLNLFIFTTKSHFPTFFFSDQSQNVNFLIFFIFFPWRGTKHPCRSKQYSESCLIWKLVYLQI